MDLATPDLDDCINLLRARCFHEAQEKLQTLLAKDKTVDVLQLLAIVEVELGNHAYAVELYDEALTLRRHPVIYNNRGVALKKAGQLQDALQSYSTALHLDPAYPDAIINRALVLRELGDHNAALKEIERAILIQPASPTAHNTHGNILLDLFDYANAEAAYNTALRFDPTFAEAHYNLGCLNQKLNRLESAIANYSMAISLRKDYPEALSNRGAALLATKQIGEALESINAALSISPTFVDALFNKALALQNLNRNDEVLSAFARALALAPGRADIWDARGCFHHDTNNFDHAIADFTRVIELDPTSYRALNNRGVTNHAVGRYDQAIRDFDRASHLNPTLIDIFNNRAVTLQAQGHFTEALATFDRAISIDPDHVDSQFNKALLLLLLGRYEEGWKLYESRKKKNDLRHHYRDYGKPVLSSVVEGAGKRVLIHYEQGYGDVIQFLRFLPKIADKNVTLIVEVPTVLNALTRSLDVNIELIAPNDPRPEFDFVLPLLSLPYVMNTLVTNIPSVVPYLRAPPKKISDFLRCLGSRQRMRVGVAWEGSPSHKKNRFRSIILSEFSILFSINIDWHILQHKISVEDQKLLSQHSNVHAHCERLGDFGDTAALIECMDMVITVDTSVAHLAGALGKPVWVLLEKVPDFRWFAEGENSPWYPTARLWRQRHAQAWSPVLKTVKADLESMLRCPEGQLDVN